MCEWACTLLSVYHLSLLNFHALGDIYVTEAMTYVLIADAQLEAQLQDRCRAAQPEIRRM